MHTLINEKQIIAYGRTRDRYYELRPQVNFYKSIELKDGYDPKHTIDNYIINHISSLKPNIIEIIRFSMDALLNNIFWIILRQLNFTLKFILLIMIYISSLMIMELDYLKILKLF